MTKGGLKVYVSGKSKKGSSSGGKNSTITKTFKKQKLSTKKRSRTGTKNKKKKWKKAPTGGINCQSDTVTVINKTRPKVRGVKTSEWNYTSNGTQRLVSSTGAQGVSLTPYCSMYGAQTNAIISEVSTTNNQYAQVSGGAVIVYQGSQGGAYNDFYIDTIERITDYVNCTEVPVTIWYYAMTARNDVSKNVPINMDPLTLATTDTTNLPDVIGSGSIGPLAVTQIGWTPYKSPSLVRNWKVTNCFKRVINPAEKYTVTSITKVKRAFAGDKLVTFDGQQLGYFRNISNQGMLVWQGGIMNDSNTKSQISYSGAALDCIETIRYNGWFNCGKSVIQVGNNNNLPTSFTVKGEIVPIEETNIITTSDSTFQS
nr:MAG: capsid protein [Cressdnaviricota sp.]